jgi:NADPH:quinone reductase-like Zn-dependent oxidoreductase
VGLSALQTARHAGAEIYATAGSPAKREYLKSLGIEHVFDSRSLTFADEIGKATKGEGIDLVVNSLTGEAIRAGLSILREGGRFMELGKTDLWDQARVSEFKPGVTFFPIALDHMMADDPQAVGRLLRAVMPQFEDRRLAPLPLRTYRIERTVDALRHMAKTEHIGKVVIQAAVGDEAPRPGQIRSDGTYLITGGLGGLGLKLAEWLVNRGARSLLLLGRSDPSPEASEALVRLRNSGAKVVPCQCDVADRSSFATLLESFDESLPPLRGVFHLAGLLDDGVLAQQSRERFDKVMASKMHGAWHLHELTRDRPLDLFVLFSSAAAILGSPGQANYAAANAFLDALAHHRRLAGLPGLSINWGAWAEVGMAARLAGNDERRLSATGLGAIEPERGLQFLEQLLNEDATQAAVLPVDWPKFLERIPEGSEPAWLKDIARKVRTASDSQDSAPVLLNALIEVTPAERRDLVIGHLQAQAALVLALDADNLPDPRRTLNELGFDSLTGVEFVNRVGRSIQKPLNPSVLFDHPTLEGLADHLLRSVLQLECADAPAAEEPDEIQVQAAEAVDGMSDDELDAMVARQLEKLQT